MRNILLLGVFGCIAYSKALECGIGKVHSDDIHNALATCVKNNETLQRIWEMTAAATSSPDSSMSDSSSQEDDQPQVQTARLTRVAKRASTIQTKTVAPPTTEEQSDKTTTSPEETTTSLDTQSGDACVVHCVFKQLGMTNDNGLPDHTKITDALMKQANERELQIFFQESAGECFQQMEQENNSDPCSYSTQLVTCLANKGRLNCEDWPAGNLPF